MENFEYPLIDQHVSNELLGEGDGFSILLLLHAEDVEEEGVLPVIHLHHLHEPAATQTALEVNPQDLALEDMRAVFDERLKTTNIHRLSLSQRLPLSAQQSQLVEGMPVSKLAAAITQHLSPEIIAKFRVMDEVDGGEVEELVALQDQQRFDLIQNVAIVDLELLRQVEVQLVP